MGQSTAKSAATDVPAVTGDVLSLQPWAPDGADAGQAEALTDWADQAAQTASEGGSAYLLQVKGPAMSQVVEAVVPLLDRLLVQKSAQVRSQKLEELVDFLTDQLVAPSPADSQMAQRLARRHARVLNEFGWMTAEQLADANQSRARNRSALAENWKKRRQVLAVRHRDEQGRAREVYPLFQFDEHHQPRKVVHSVLAAFGPDRAAWNLALWFTSANGWLPDQARPVDLIETDPEAVLQAARHDAAGSGA
jgi:hypothetical protein